MSIIFSGIQLNSNEITFIYDNYLCINLFEIYKNITFNIEDENLLLLLKKNNDIVNIKNTYIFNPAYDLLFEQFKNISYNDIDYNKIIYIHITLFKIFNGCLKINNVKTNSYINKINFLNINNKLIIRTGVVELRACNIINNDIFNKAIMEVANNINNESYIMNTSKTNKLKCWITTFHDYNCYIKTIIGLMTNAGFYFSGIDDCITNFNFFKTEYISAMENANYLTHWPFLNCFSLNILNNIKKNKNLELIQYPSDNDLISLFNNKSILFLTPFKELIDTQYNNQTIYKLRKKNNLTNIKLDTIEVFLTTYPNVKHSNFIETYNYYISKIDDMFTKNNYDIFTCSCGCYGIILCNYVFKKYNITSFYIGNRINSFFGIKFNNKNTNLDENYDLFLMSDLNEKYKNLENVDNNSYGFTTTE